jgi:hypothetical protein
MANYVASVCVYFMKGDRKTAITHFSNKNMQCFSNAPWELARDPTLHDAIFASLHKTNSGNV